MRKIWECVAGLTAALLLAGCAGADGFDGDESASTTEQALGSSFVLKAERIYSSTYTAEYWLPTARQKAKDWGLPVNIEDQLNTGMTQGSATLTFCTGPDNSETCQTRTVTLKRNTSVLVPYPSQPTHSFRVGLANGQWKAWEIVAGPGYATGVRTYYTGRYEY